MPMNLFPYTNFHELNLDWVIAQIKTINQTGTETAGYAQEAKLYRDAAQVQASNALASANSANQAMNTAQDAATLAGERAGQAAASASQAQQYAEHIGDPVSGLVTQWLQEHVDPATGYVIDNTLTIAGAAADAAAVGRAIDSQNSKLNAEVNKLNAALYTDGDSVTIQRTNADTFVQNSPSGVLHVKNINGAIYAGTINFIDLFGLAQGVFTDSNSGVTIEITGNEVYVHGNASTGFRFDFQTGEFYTDAFANHPADFSKFPSDHVVYTFCWWEKDNYVLPSTIYIADLINGTLSPTNLQGHSKDMYVDEANQFLTMYSNGALSNLDFKFTMGLKIRAMPGTFASIEAVAKASYDTTIINAAGYYALKSFTWTGQQTVYEAVEAIPVSAEDVLTKDHVFAWFGDSLSQLKELPNLVSDLLYVNVYDCTFAGAPLTYGDPTKYQPTGFMSLCSQIVAHDFTPLSDALDAQEAAGINVTEKRQHLATLEALDFSTVTDVVLLAGTNDFDNDYVNASNFVNGFSGALFTLLTEYPHLMVYVIAPTWRGDKDEGTATIPTMEDIVRLEKEVADSYSLPFYDLYHRSGINQYTASVYLTNDLLHPSDAGDALLANKCAKFLRSN